MFKYPKLKFTNISRLFALASVVVFTLSLTVSESISAPKPSGWTDLFSDINYGGPDGGVYDIIEYNNALLVAGEFGSVGGILSGTIYANNIAAFDGSVWHSIGTGLTGTDAVVNAMVEYNGDLIVAGSFDMAGSVEANNIAKWNSWTGGWEPLGSGVRGEYYPGVYALYVFNDELYAGGSFTEAGTVTTEI